MTNSWSLLYDELYGGEEMSPCKIDDNDGSIISDGVTIGFSTASEESSTYFVDTANYDNITIDTSNWNPENSYTHIPFSSVSTDTIRLDYECLSEDTQYPSTPSIQKETFNKYEEDKSLKDVKDYVSSTYNGHYTSKANNVQTLDLIESVGDAESFCRSNAIKYLSRYDKRGQAKRDILKAIHYCLLLYYFSGNTQDEITTRGYETF